MQITSRCSNRRRPSNRCSLRPNLFDAALGRVCRDPRMFVYPPDRRRGRRLIGWAKSLWTATSLNAGGSRFLCRGGLLASTYEAAVAASSSRERKKSFDFCRWFMKLALVAADQSPTYQTDLATLPTSSSLRRSSSIESRFPSIVDAKPHC